MVYCAKCGSQMPEGANFCGSCGNTLGGPAGPSGWGGYAPPPVIEPLDFTIVGSNLQIARVRLAHGQEVYAEAGRMIYKTANVAWETRMTGKSLGDKLMGALRRTFTGESLFVTYFHANGPGEVGFAGSYPGKIQSIDLAPGQTMLAQKEAFLFAQPSIQMTVAFVKKLGAGFFGGEGFILQRLVGPGLVFIHAGGDFVEFLLGPGQTVQVETGCIVAFEETVNYDIEFIGSIKTAFFGGEGLFLASLTGPGKVILQSMTLQKMRRELAPQATVGNEHSINPLNAALGGLFGGDEG